MPSPSAPTKSSAESLADLPGTLTFAAYRGLAAVLSPVIPFLLARRAAAGKADAARVAERYGTAAQPRPPGRIVWMHAASVGETLALVPLVRQMIAAGFGVVFTSGTVTSAAIAAERLPQGATHQYAPLDVTRYVARFLDHWRPELMIIAESEIWPATLHTLARRGIPVVIVNGRFSDRAFRSWHRIRALAAPIFGSLSLVLAQSDEDAARFTAMGAPRVSVTGNLKWDAPPLAADAAEMKRLAAATAGRPLWLAASTHAGEEEIVATAHKTIAATRPGVLTVVVPRHPPRGDAVAATLAAAGLTVARRSRGEIPTASIAVYLADTLGELGLFYRLAPVALVGNSLVDGGGHNPLEAVQLGAAVLYGPFEKNFADVFARLDRATPTARVTDAASLAAAVVPLLADPTAALRLADAQRAAFAGLGGALDATMAALRPYLAARAA